MFRDVSACNTYNYGDALYWEARYIQEVECGSFDWYQRYSSLRPFIRKYISPNSRVLMVGCGNAVISDDMVKDGFEDIVNIDISSVAIEMMKKKYENVPQLKYMQMDVKDMSFFPDDSFESVIDKGTLDSLMCGTDAPLSASQMLGEVCRGPKLQYQKIHVECGTSESKIHIRCGLACGFPMQEFGSRDLIEIVLKLCTNVSTIKNEVNTDQIRLLKPGGVYMLITYGDPTARMPHINRIVYNWKIELYIIPKPGFQRPAGAPARSHLEPVPLTEKGLLPADFVLEDPDSHFIYVCKKLDVTTDLSHKSANPLADDTMQR